MFRCLCLSLLSVLLLSGIVHADVRFSTPEDYIFPTSPSTMEEADSPSTQGFANFVTDSAITDPTISTTVALEASSTTQTTTNTPTTSQTNATTVSPTNATTVSPTNATTVSPTNATTVSPTNATTVSPTNATTVSPTNATTVSPTNATTVSPTNATTPFPTTPAPLPNPSIGDYVVRADPKSPVCLKAKMGVQLRFKPAEDFQTVNLDPNVTHSSGSCGSNGTDSTLSLVSGNITIQFVFANQTNKFRLSALNFTLDNGNGSVYSIVNLNLSLWEASLGSSYMCRKEQTYNITDSLTLNTFELQVQPFGVANDKFSTAHECSVDDTSLLIPIIVGAALAGLIIIVVIAYMIGRRKTHVGYQTL